MFKVKISSVGRSKEPWLKMALEEYEKRLSRQMEIEWVLAKDETDLFEKINGPFIALDVLGEQVDSPQLSKKLNSLWSVQGPRLHFLIGASTGIPKKILERSTWIWSLSQLTFTHQMTRLILLEQLYRALQIESGTSYHK